MPGPGAGAPYGGGGFGAQSYNPPGMMMGGGGSGPHNPYQQPMQSYSAPYGQPHSQHQPHSGQAQYGQQSYGAPPAAGGYGGSANPYGNMSAPPPAPAPAPSPWSEHKTDDGNTYWYNSVSGVSQVSSCTFCAVGVR
jgi:far upstream element-binding protein